MKKTIFLLMLLCLNQSCGQAEPSDSSVDNFLVGGGWELTDSPYMLPPGSTIGVCNSENTAVSQYVVKAVRLWLDAGGRDERIRVLESCTGTRVIHLNKLSEKVNFYGRAHPLTGNLHNLDVPSQWASHWTANHEIGHVFGFGHIFDGVVSIMNSDENGKYMNRGYLSDYDRAEIKRMLNLEPFRAVNALWAKKDTSETGSISPVATAAPAVKPAGFKSCLGANGKTYYSHKVVTSYQGSLFTCNNGQWIRG